MMMLVIDSTKGIQTQTAEVNDNRLNTSIFDRVY